MPDDPIISLLKQFLFLVFAIVAGTLLILFVMNAALHNMGYGGW